MAVQMTPELEQKINGFIGRGGDHVTRATDRVTVEAIRQAANVVGDCNPAYHDGDFASASRSGGVVAPPCSVLWWHRPYLEPVPSAEQTDVQGVRRFRLDPNPIRQHAGGPNENGVLAEMMQVLADAGFGSLVVTNAAVSVDRYPLPGDLLSCYGPTIESVSARKQTALGEGYFSTSAYVLRDERGAQVAQWKTTRFHFKPAAKAPLSNSASAAAKPAQAPTAAASSAQLAPWIVEVTPTLVIAAAIATRDIQDVHHDRDLSLQRGFSDIFLNNFTSMALVSRYVTDWAGPHAIVRSFSFKLSKPQYPHDQLRFTGSVRSDTPTATGRALELHIVGENASGTHIASDIVVELPLSA